MVRCNNTALQIQALDRIVYYLAGALSYVTTCLDPFIYASRYEVFRRELKNMLNKNEVTPNNAG